MSFEQQNLPTPRHNSVNNNVIATAAFIGIAMIVSGCGSLSKSESSLDRTESNATGIYKTDVYQRPIEFFEPILIDDRIAQLRLEERVDHLFLVIDKQAPENETIRGLNTPEFIDEVVQRFTSTLPNKQYRGIFMVVEGDATLAPENTINPLLTEKDAVYESVVDIPRIKVSSISEGITNFSNFIKETQSRGALIVVASSGQINKQVEGAVVAMRRATRYKSSTPSLGACFYMVGVGDKLTRTSMETTDSCGFLTAANNILQAKDMSNFVEQVLYKGPADTDGDGIFDYVDQCPNTPTDRIVDYVGCLRFK